MPVSLLSTVACLQVCLLVLIVHAEDSFDCSGQDDDSYHPIYDADDCQHYWHCIYVNTVYMHAVRRVCPAGTAFEPTLRQCETSSLVPCAPPRSPHMPRTSTTTQAWKWRYSKLFARKRWKATAPIVGTTRRHNIFDVGEASEVGTTTMSIEELETTQKIEVLPFTPRAQVTAGLSLEQVSKTLYAFKQQRRPPFKIKSGVNFFQPGEPENEVELYSSAAPVRPTNRPATQSPPSYTTIPIPLSAFVVTMESVATMTTPTPIPTTVTTTTTTTTTTTLMTTTTTTITTTETIGMTTTIAETTPMDFLPWTSEVITQPAITRRIIQQARISGQRRRNNMTLFILTSDEHKIRQFPINHTRGILINCNQLRRRLLGRRLRGVLLTSTSKPRPSPFTLPAGAPFSTHHSQLARHTSTSCMPTCSYSSLALTLFSLVFLPR